MAVITVDGNAGGAQLRTDDRFRQWGKLIRSPRDFDLSKHNGYSLIGPWAEWGKSTAVAPGQFLVLASESGSRNRHSYHYALITVTADDVAAMVPDTDVDEVIAAADLLDAVRAKARNSRLYAYAVYASLLMLAPDGGEVSLMDAAREVLRGLTSEQREAIVAEFAALAAS